MNSYVITVPPGKPGKYGSRSFARASANLWNSLRGERAAWLNIAPIAQLVSALDLVTSSVQVEGSILTAGKRLGLKNLNVIIRAIN